MIKKIYKNIQVYLKENIMKMDTKGQISVELLLLISFSLISAILLANAIIDANELNVAMASARDGAFEGIKRREGSCWRSYKL